MVHGLDVTEWLGEVCSAMQGRFCFSRLSAVVLLVLCTLPPSVDAQQRFVCWPIAAGDTAIGLARQLTGKAAAAYGLGFQIRDPVRRMFVPKSQYQRLQSDWQACVSPAPVLTTPVAYAPVVDLGASITTDPAMASMPQPLASASVMPTDAHRTVFDGPLVASIGAAVLLIVLLSAVAGPLAQRPIPPAVRRAGENFATVFARPLVDPSSGVPPIQMRLRFVRRTQQLEISLAPGPGHRYPNLSDHKKNVEYDVDRVMQVLGNFVMSKPLRAAGKWVVVTITIPGSSE